MLAANDQQSKHPKHSGSNSQKHCDNLTPPLCVYRTLYKFLGLDKYKKSFTDLREKTVVP